LIFAVIRNRFISFGRIGSVINCFIGSVSGPVYNIIFSAVFYFIFYFFPELGVLILKRQKKRKTEYNSPNKISWLFHNNNFNLKKKTLQNEKNC